MDNIFDLVKSLSSQNTNQTFQNDIPKEIIDQYPYGDFPIKYTRHGQEVIRKQSERRFEAENNVQPKQNIENNVSINSLLPLIQILTNKKNQPKDMLKVISKLFFKDNPELQGLLNLINIKGDNPEKQDSFPDTNKVQINNLKKIN